MRTRSALILMALAAATCTLSSRAIAAESVTNRPFIAIWRDHDGMPARGTQSEAPYLRIAIWNDGRVLYSSDTTNQWSHNLRVGQIGTNRIAALKQSLAETGVSAFLLFVAPGDAGLGATESTPRALSVRMKPKFPIVPRREKPACVAAMVFGRSLVTCSAVEIIPISITWRFQMNGSQPQELYYKFWM